MKHFKENIDKYAAGLVWFVMIFTIFLTYTRDFIDLVDFALKLTMFYLSISSLYFIFIKNLSDRDRLIKMYIIYFSSIFIVLSLLFSTNEKINQIKIDYWKTKLEFMKKTDQNITSAYSSLEKLYSQYLNQYKTEKITVENLQQISEKKSAPSKATITIYENLYITSFIIITEFMIIWLLVEFHIMNKLLNIIKYIIKKISKTKEGLKQ
ncbi:MAG: hypothetical protein QM490_00935 [Candidatus Gracilibacteria bacterium]